jgi:polyisoprenoid-binding protein YceI
MKKGVLFTLIPLFLSIILRGQIFMCQDGVTKFTSEAPLEMIKAQSNKTVGAVDFSNKNVAFAIAITTFEGFNSALQKEHFLENYMEAQKYPKATFKGKIIEDVDCKKDGTYSVRAKGIFNIHGIDKEKIVKVKMVVKGGSIDIDSDFEVPLADHDIRIPKIVNQKIASIISVQVKATLKPKS